MRLPRQRLSERSDHTDTGYSGQTGPDAVLSSAWSSEPPRSHQETERGRTLNLVEYHFWWDCWLAQQMWHQSRIRELSGTMKEIPTTEHPVACNVGSSHPCDIIGGTSSGAMQCPACKGATRENISIKEHLIKKTGRKKGWKREGKEEKGLQKSGL